MLWRINQAFTMHVTLSIRHFLRSYTLLDNIKLLIDSILQLVELLFLCDVTDTISP